MAAATVPTLAAGEAALSGWLLGVLTGVALLNLIAWWSTRSALYALFALFVGCSALRWAAIDGLLPALLHTDDAALIQRLGDTLQGAQAVIGSLCQMHWLQLHRRLPWLRAVYSSSSHWSTQASLRNQELSRTWWASMKCPWALTSWGDRA